MAALSFNSNYSKKGFTLIEIMVAISIIGLLAILGLVFFQGAQKTARDAKRKSDVNDIKQALIAYHSTAGTFCFSGVGVCSASPLDGKDTIASFNGLTTFYHNNAIPTDPSNSANNYWIYINGDETFQVDALLETNTGAGNGTQCATNANTNSYGINRNSGAAANYNYCVDNN